MQPSMSRTDVRRGGLIGVGIGLVLLGLTVFFVVTGVDEPPQALGVFLPLAAALVSLALGALALVPLWRGDRAGTALELAWVLRGIAALGLLVTATGVARSEIPWTAGGLLPLLVVAALVKDSRRLARRAAAGRAQDAEPPAQTNVPPA